MTFKNNPKGQSIISIKSFSCEDIEFLYEQTDKICNLSLDELAKTFTHEVMLSAFFQPSTRTRLSFERAMLALGGKVMGFADAKTTSGTKGEQLSDTIEMFEQYEPQVVVMRHPYSGAARLLNELIDVPSINAGDGDHEHPTQTLGDGYAKRSYHNRLDGLTEGLFGDLAYGRTIKSMIHFFTKFHPKKVFLCPADPFFDLPDEYKKILDQHKIDYEVELNIDKAVPELDTAYFTRIQDNMFDKVKLNEEQGIDVDSIERAYKIDVSMLSKAKNNLTLMHPLPRRNEIDINIDKTHHAKYFDQAGKIYKTRIAELYLILKGAVE